MIALLAAALATLWGVLQSGIVAAAALIAALAVIAGAVRWCWRGVRRLATQVRDVHGVILGDDGRPSLVDRLERGDQRFKRVEGDISSIRGGLQEVNRKVGNMEGTIDVLGAQERQEIRTILSVAAAREKQRPEGQSERRKNAGL